MVHNSNFLVQVPHVIAPTSFHGFGPLGDPGLVDQRVAASTFTKVISNVVGIFSVIAIIWFVILLFSGALKLMLASGDKVKVQNAQKQITGGLIGLLIVLLGIFLINLVGSLIGIPNILSIDTFILLNLHP